MDTVIRVQILDVAASISENANNFRKDMNQTIFPPTI